MSWLFRKDLPWLWPAFVAGFAATFGVSMSSSFARAWIMPGLGHFEDLQHPLWIFGVLAGALLAIRDPASRTEDLLAHRAVTPARVFRARVTLGLALVVALGLVPVLLAVARGAANGFLRADLVDVSRFGVLGSLVLFAAASFAVALFAFSLPLAWPLRTCALAVTWLPLALLHGALGKGIAPGAVPTVTAHAIAMLATTVAVLALARRTAGVRWDADRPLPRRAYFAILIGCGTATAIAATVGISLLQEAALRTLARGRPFAVVRSDGTVARARWADPFGRQLELIDADRRVVVSGSEGELGVTSETHAPAVSVRVADPFDLRFSSDRSAASLFPGTDRGESWTFCRDAGTGELSALVESWRDGSVRRVPGVRRPDGESFSSATLLFTAYVDDAEAVFAADLAHGSVWRILPDGDRAIAVQPTPLPDADRPVELAWMSGDGRSSMGLAGERGSYRWDGASWQRAAAAFARSVSPSRAATDRTDALTPELVVRDAQGTELFRERLSVNGLAESALAVAAALPGVLRPLPSALWTIARPVTATQRPWTQDPVLADRTWLLFLPLCGTALAVGVTRRRLRRLGADAARVRAWTIATALGGPVLLVALRALERARAYRRIDAPPAAPPRIGARARATVTSA